jgi:hypothetical protein
MKRLLLTVCLLVGGLGGMGAASQTVALAAGGNSGAAHACQNGGYLMFQGIDGTTFTNVAQCVSYAAHGGAITCAETSISGCLTFNNATMPSAEGTGNSITLTGSIAFVDTCASGNCSFATRNTLASGAGTYAITNSSGDVISQGTFQVADKANTSEGLLNLSYMDGSGDYASSCASATGLLGIGVNATLTDTTTRKSQPVLLTGFTGINTSSPQGRAVTPGDFFIGDLPSTALTITC